MKRFAVFASVVCMALVGCGGGGGGMAGGGTTGGTGGGANNTVSGSASVLAATFQVDVNSGKVSVVSQKGSLAGSARAKPGLFTGNSIGFNSSQLTNDNLGGSGIRALQVSLTNNTDIAVGSDANGNAYGLEVIFGGFANTTGIVDQRPNTTVSKLAGASPGFADGSTATALLHSPAGVAFGSDGSLYAADFGNNRIRKIKSGFVTTFAGSGTAAETDGGSTTAAFNGPYAIATNPVDGSLVVVDFTGNKIRRVTASGVVETIAGTGVAGGANGAGNVATFTNPTGAAVDSNGNIYISESGSNRIRKVVLSGGSPDLSSHYTVTTLAGNGTGGHVDGAGSAAEFFHPYGLACDSGGNVYVAEYSNNDVRKVDPAGNVSTIAGTGTQSELDGYGNAATFNRPFGVAYANGALFITDSGGERVREAAPVPGGSSGPASWAVETLAGAGTAGSANGTGSSATFNTPYGIAANGAENLFVADFGNSQLRQVEPSTGTFPIGVPAASTSTEAVQLSNPTGFVDGSDFGSAPYIVYPGSLNAGQTSSAQAWNFVVPSGVTSFQFQVMVEASTTQLLPLQSATGAGSPLVDVRTFTGSAIGGIGTADGTATTALFRNPEGLARGASGTLYVCDAFGNSIRRVDPFGNVTTIAGSLSVPGAADGPGSTATFNEPFDIAVSPDESELFVADSNNNEIRRIAFQGGDPTNPSNWSVSTIAGSTTPGFADGPGNTAGLNYVTGVLLVYPNELYVSEYIGNRIRKIQFTGGNRSASSAWNVSTLAGDTSAAAGASGFVNGQGTTARFFGPERMCLDGAGNLYVGDTQNRVIRKIDSAANVTTFAGNGSSGHIDGPALSAEFSFPSDVKIDTAGYFYVADIGNEAVREISPGGIVSTVAGNGADATIDGPGSTAALNGPCSLALSPSGTMYVCCQAGPNIRLIQDVFSAASGPRQRTR